MPDSRDLNRQAFSGDQFHRSYTLNLTSQLSQKNKVNFFYHLGQRHLDNDSSVTVSPEAASYLTSAHDYLAQIWWTNPLTTRLLFEGGGTFFNETWRWLQRDIPGIVNGYGPGVTVPKVESSISTSYGAYNGNTSSHAFNHQRARAGSGAGHWGPSQATEPGSGAEPRSKVKMRRTCTMLSHRASVS